jgi:Tol biopolymer transport system component
MPEMREVYHMVTRQRPPEPGALERQAERQRRSLRNRKLGTIALSAALAVLVVLFVLNGWNATDRGNQPANTVIGHSPELPSETGVYLLDLETKRAMLVPDIPPPGYDSPSIAVAPEATMIAYAGTYAEGEQPVIYVANIDGTNIRALEKTAATTPERGEVAGPEFSPDGSQIVYQAKDDGNGVGDLFVVDVATGKPTRLTHLSPHVQSGLWYMGPTFTPDGRRVLFTRPTGSHTNDSWGLWSIPASGGRPTLMLRNTIGGRLSPDGRMLVYFKYKPSPQDFFLGQMWIADADGTHARRIASGDVFTARWSPDGTKIVYLNGDRAYIVDVTTGEISRVLEDTNRFPEWVDDHTWIIGVD